MTNRLAEETSPYLLQHQDNPVDWWPWGPDAFAEARRRDVPILLSVGYAACHWCHVMERESFEDPDVARVMNEGFVCVKVDREERPDVDAVYMEAVQVMTGQGGWPMTVFLTPGGTPFYGGTYFPPEDRYGMPSFVKLLNAIRDAWTNRREEVERQAGELTSHIDVAGSIAPSAGALEPDLLMRALEGMERSFDPEHGGFGRAPKFPQPMTIDFLLRMAARGHERAREMAITTLDAMAAGGMFDQLGGGFARYSVDRQWIVPHFEKMLYDNAQLLRTYARAYQLGRDPRHLEVAEATANWMLEEMRDEAGGFWSTLDADSEGVEGKFYVWSLAEVRDIAGEDADAAIEHWGFSEAGNFEALNIPIRTGDPDDPQAIERARRRLLEARGRRVRPATDTKVLAGWNALAASALAEAGAGLDRPQWIALAEECLDFVLTRMRLDGRLMRSYKNTGGGSVVKHLAYCEDYAFLLEAQLSLFEATGDGRWLADARWTADEAIRLFADGTRGGFYTTGTDAERLVVRPKDLFDNAIPSANSVLAVELQKLAAITGDQKYEDMAFGTIRLVQDMIARSPLGFGHLLGAVDLYTEGPLEVVVFPVTEDSAEMIAEIQSRFIPNKILVDASGAAASGIPVPLLDQRGPVDGKTTAYVCRRGLCKLPVTDLTALADQLTQQH